MHGAPRSLPVRMRVISLMIIGIPPGWVADEHICCCFCLGFSPVLKPFPQVLAKFHKKYGTKAGSSIEYNYFWIGMK